MRSIGKKEVMIFSLLACCSSGVHGQSLLDQIQTAISQGAADVSLRVRSETVEQDNALNDASAATLRTRLSLRSATVGGFSGLIEFDNVSVVGADHYDSLITDKYRGSYSVVADPVGSEINQAYINYRLDEAQNFTVGTQRINHAAQRFVGSVAWRQNEQTLDSLTYTRRSSDLDIDYSYVWNVNRIFGTSKSSVQATNLDSDSHIGLATYKSEFGNVSAYTYALDFADDAPALSSVTYGLSYTNTFSDIAVNAAYATQSDYGENPVSYDAKYLAADVAYSFGPVRLLLGYELLGSDDGITAFKTPLATLHKWQGWSDLFLGTPNEGIEDTYLTLSGNIAGANVAATYHDFNADEGSLDYGSEWDIIGTYQIRSNVSVQLKYATYDSDSLRVDTDKLWLTVNLAF